ncbi:Galactarate dehydratase (L-threo-forming) [subsurface metagenome]
MESHCSMEYLTVGLKCGLSDTTSGIASNPAVGIAADNVIESGGTVIFGETPELIGAEHILKIRIHNILYLAFTINHHVPCMPTAESSCYPECLSHSISSRRLF